MLVRKVLVAFSLLVQSIEAAACKPVTLLMTHASSVAATFRNDEWTLPGGLSTVNTANIAGALQYIMLEAIDSTTGYVRSGNRCTRKNGIAYIHFLEVTFCNPDPTLSWFNQGSSKFSEYGQFLPMQAGVCHSDPYCATLHGFNDAPNLGPYVGFRDMSAQARNPTPGAYWYSLPGECPLFPVSEKSAQCKAAHRSGECPKGRTPDGNACTWSYKVLGQVQLDDLVGITAVRNPATGAMFKTAQEYCLAGHVEFQRNPTTFDFVRGLAFWRNPKHPAANTQRVQKLLERYATGSNNIALPTAESLILSNPACYTSSPGCFDGQRSVCARDSSMRCLPCNPTTSECEAAVNPSNAFPQLPAIQSQGGFVSTASTARTFSLFVLVAIIYI